MRDKSSLLGTVFGCIFLIGGVVVIINGNFGIGIGGVIIGAIILFGVFN